ncbi:hypothetical protein JJB07_12160 [Tumebacillus sp. ITR2]|uniref:Uncharacterized protein n=1 Tax=Tumebacillus amylolyticus TaxID=2801339 RepID=A0ABS1JAW0_9BACL|nr:CBO0543 family protein [Tumebacillus amylolyticus]MBL0387407.1 hypothetical protein [Tumebacillus amylolyticus]
MTEDKTQNFQKVLEIRRTLRDLELQDWLQHDLFTFNWWLSLVLTIVFWLVWFKLVDRKRLLEICFYGAMVVIASVVLDIAGVNLVLWGYKSRLEPLTPALIPGDLVMMPVLYTLIYQRYGQNTRNFLVATTILSAVMSFVVEPILIRLGIYHTVTWTFFYSFPIYIILSFLMRQFVHKVLRHQKSPFP